MGNSCVCIHIAANILNLTYFFLGQDERIEELRDTHKLESKSQSEQIDKLHKQMEETEVLLKASQSTETNKKDESQKTNAEMEKLKAEAEKFKTIAAQEEEKRTKAIVLLKTVRQKLVKAEKERDDAMREVNDLKEKDRVEKIKEKSERLKLQQEIEQVNLEREKAVAGLKAQFDREVSNLKDRKEKETSALKGQYELEAITLKVSRLAPRIFPLIDCTSERQHQGTGSSKSTDLRVGELGSKPHQGQRRDF